MGVFHGRLARGVLAAPLAWNQFELLLDTP